MSGGRLGERSPQPYRQCWVETCDGLARLGKLQRQQPGFRQTFREGSRGLQSIAERRKIAGTAAIEGKARQSAADVGRGFEARPDLLAQARLARKKRDRIEAGVNLLGSWSGRRQPLGEQAAAWRGDGLVDRR